MRETKVYCREVVKYEVCIKLSRDDMNILIAGLEDNRCNPVVEELREALKCCLHKGE